MKNRQWSANMYLRYFYHACFQMFDNNRKQYVIILCMSLGVGLLHDFTGHGYTPIQEHLQLFKYEEIQHCRLILVLMLSVRKIRKMTNDS